MSEFVQLQHVHTSVQLQHVHTSVQLQHVHTSHVYLVFLIPVLKLFVLLLNLVH